MESCCRCYCYQAGNHVVASWKKNTELVAFYYAAVRTPCSLKWEITILYDRFRVTFHYPRFVELLLKQTIIASNRGSTSVIHVNWWLQVLCNCFEIMSLMLNAIPTLCHLKHLLSFIKPTGYEYFVLRRSIQDAYKISRNKIK